jgi:uncharacterized protein YjbI with pentapeptide repeats
LFSFTISRNERKAADQHNQTEREIAQDNQQEVVLQEYIDKMSELLLHEKLRESRPEDEVRTVARVRTLTTLHRLDEVRKGSVLQFLLESKLIDRDKSIVDLDGADLHLANLRKASLHKANLSQADLSSARLGSVDLTYADLSEANLRKARLAEADLSNAKFIGADLRKADLRGDTILTLPARNRRGFLVQRADLPLDPRGYSRRGHLSPSVSRDGLVGFPVPQGTL